MKSDLNRILHITDSVQLVAMPRCPLLCKIQLGFFTWIVIGVCGMKCICQEGQGKAFQGQKIISLCIYSNSEEFHSELLVKTNCDLFTIDVDLFTIDVDGNC